jgi:hypothetical protein
MKHYLILVFAIVVVSNIFAASEPKFFDTRWIPTKPEMLTYRSTSKQGDGLYQVSIAKSDSTIEIYMNIITNGFTKTVSGTMTLEMVPLQSKGKIIVNGQIIMETACSYEKDKLHISTLMKPYNQTMKNDHSFSTLVVDFSQLPLIARTLSLNVGAEFGFQSLNPQTNAIVPFTLKVLGEEKIKSVDCYKVESNDFEGRSFFWIEKDSHHRVVRIEQPETNRITELIQ